MSNSAAAAYARVATTSASPRDIEAQTRQVMTNLNHALAELEAGWEDVVNATVYTTRPDEYETIGRAIIWLREQGVTVEPIEKNVIE